MLLAESVSSEGCKALCDLVMVVLSAEASRFCGPRTRQAATRAPAASSLLRENVPTAFRRRGELMKRFVATALSAAMVVSMATSAYAETTIGKVCFTMTGTLPAGIPTGSTLALEVDQFGNEIFETHGYIQLATGTCPFGTVSRSQIPVVGSALLNTVTAPGEVIFGFTSSTGDTGATATCPTSSFTTGNMNVSTLAATGGWESPGPVTSGTFTLAKLSSCPALTP